MATGPAPTLTTLLGWTIASFCKAMAAETHKRGIAFLSLAIWNRTKGLERRFGALYARWKAGTLPKKGTSPRPSPHSGEGEEAGRMGGASAVAYPPPQPSPSRGEGDSWLLPRGLGWVQKLLPESGPALGGGVLSLVWNEPETQAFVAAAPQAGRILRPLCRMVGVQTPEWLRLPKRARRKRGPGEARPGLRGRPLGRKKDTSPRPSPHSGEGEKEPAIPPAGGDGGATDAVAMRERAAAWVAGKPQPPSTLLPLGISRAFEPRDPWGAPFKIKIGF